MSKMRDLVTDILADIDEGEMSFEQIAVKHEVSVREVRDLAFGDGPDVGYHDELERDWDEPYEMEPDAYLDASYEDRYEVEF